MNKFFGLLLLSVLLSVVGCGGSNSAQVDHSSYESCAKVTVSLYGYDGEGTRVLVQFGNESVTFRSDNPAAVGAAITAYIRLVEANGIYHGTNASVETYPSSYAPDALLLVCVNEALEAALKD